VGGRSRELEFAVRVLARGAPERGTSSAQPLDPPLVATTARGVVVVPPRCGRPGRSASRA